MTDRAKGMRVSHANAAEVAAWCGGEEWATDELAQRRRTDAEREALRAKRTAS